MLPAPVAAVAFGLSCAAEYYLATCRALLSR